MLLDVDVGVYDRESDGVDADALLELVTGADALVVDT